MCPSPILSPFPPSSEWPLAQILFTLYSCLSSSFTVHIWTLNNTFLALHVFELWNHYYVYSSTALSSPNIMLLRFTRGTVSSWNTFAFTPANTSVYDCTTIYSSLAPFCACYCQQGCREHSRAWFLVYIRRSICRMFVGERWLCTCTFTDDSNLCQGKRTSSCSQQQTVGISSSIPSLIVTLLKVSI